MKNESYFPDWVYTVAHIGGVLFVLCILLAVVFIFVTIICDEIADAKGVREGRRTQNMIDYAKRDVELTEALYGKLGDHPNDRK